MSWVHPFLFFCVLSFFSYSSCLYLNLLLNKEKCFYDNFYYQMVVIIRYEIMDQDLKNLTTLLSKDDRFEISVYSKSDKKVINTFKGQKLTGKFSQSIDNSGEYKICIKTNDKELFRRKRFIKLSFAIDTSEDELEDEEKVVKIKDFEMVNEKVKRVLKKAETFSNIQNYQTKIEDKFSQNQIKSSRLLATLSIIQIIIICIVGLYHVYSLRNIFKEKIWAPF